MGERIVENVSFLRTGNIATKVSDLQAEKDIKNPTSQERHRTHSGSKHKAANEN